MNIGTALAIFLFLAALAVTVAAWLWGPSLWLGWRRERVRRQPFPAPWREVLRRHMPLFATLPADVQLQLKKHAQVLIAEKPFIGCAGMLVTDEMRVLVAVQASLLLLHRRAGYFRNLRQVLIYPGAFVVDRVAADPLGLARETRRVLSGESWQRGEVVLSWGDVLAGAADPHDGHNVVLHEFAHQLDQENGPANGAPWISGRRQRERWAAVMGEAFARLQRQLGLGEPAWVDAYAATDPAEFFAVLSECFFERPESVRDMEPAAFAELAAFYRTNPLYWRQCSPASNAPQPSTTNTTASVSD